MFFFTDPIILILLGLVAISSVIALRPRSSPEIWLLIMTLLLFGLPRAGIFVPAVGLPLPLAHILAAVLIMEWLLICHHRQKVHKSYGKFFLVYAAIAGIGLFVGLSYGSHYKIAFIELFLYLYSIGIFFYVSEAFAKKHFFMSFVWLLLTISILVSIYGIAQKFIGSSILIDKLTYNSATQNASSYIVSSQSMRRVLSSYGDPNVLACQLLVFIGIGLAMFIGKNISPRNRVIAVIVVALNVTCLVFTGSRAGLLCLVLMTFLIFLWRSRWTLFTAPAIIVFIVMFSGGMINGYIESRFGTHALHGDHRINFPSMAWQMLETSPLGCGLGRMLLVDVQELGWSLKIIPATSIWNGYNSFWLNLFCRLGLPGVVGFILILVALVRHIRRQLKLIQDPLVVAVIVGALIGTICQLFIWIANNTYMLPGGSLNFWFMTGMLVAGCRAYAVEPDKAPARDLWTYPNPSMVFIPVNSIQTNK
ncbi:MAG: O-antigen ligase family protein [Phycisphaerae bacterium]|nr:O-antigen ligase family protein [Phycisphaerae bacterium]